MKHRRPLLLLPLLVVLTVIGSCSLVSRTETRVVFPPGVTADPAALRIEAAVSTDGSVPAAFTVQTPARSKAEGDAVTVELHFHEMEIDVLLRAWVDLNGNGTRDEGDLEGALAAPVHARDPGGCGDNLTVTPPLVLTSVRLAQAP